MNKDYGRVKASLAAASRQEGCRYGFFIRA